MVDDHGVSTPLRLRALARIVDQERVDQWQRADRSISPTGCRHSYVLARQPFEIAVLAEVNNGVGPERLLQPPIHRKIVVRWSKIRIVVDRYRVFAESSWRLDQDHQIARLQCGRNDFTVLV